MEISSLISKPRNSSKSRITSRTRVTEVVAGAIGSIALYTIWAVIPSGRSDSGRNAAKSVATRVARSVSTRGSGAVAVGGGTAVPWNMLEHRQHPACQQAVRHRAGDRRNLVCSIAVSTVADHGVRPRDGNVGDWKAIDVDTDSREIGGNQAGTEIGGSEPCCDVAVVDTAIGGPRRIGRPIAAGPGAGRARPPDRRARPHPAPPPHEMTQPGGSLAPVYRHSA